jgi:hypothetical protein
MRRLRQTNYPRRSVPASSAGLDYKLLDYKPLESIVTLGGLYLHTSRVTSEFKWFVLQGGLTA